MVMLGATLVIICALSAVADLAKVPSITTTMERLGVPGRALPLLASVKLSAACAVLVGFVVTVSALAAGVVLVVYFAGAVVAHTRVADPFRESAAATVSLVLSMTYLLTALAI